jgi:hypothetical protein
MRLPATSALLLLLAEARVCAATLIDTALRLRREVPNVSMPESHRVEAGDVIASLFRAGKNVLEEVEALERSFDYGRDEKRIMLALSHLKYEFLVEGRQLHELAQHLEQARNEDPKLEPASVLVRESAWKLLLDIDRFQKSLEALLAED